MVSGTDERANASPSHGGLESFDIDLDAPEVYEPRDRPNVDQLESDENLDFEGEIDEDPDDDDEVDDDEVDDDEVDGTPQARNRDSDVIVGAVLADRYRVLDIIGKGGMGKVYLAEHVAIRKKVAIKVLSQSYCHRPDQVKRFLREAQAASTIEHDNVIDIFDYGETDNGSVFFAMELLEGLDLGGVLHEELRIPWARARHIFLQIVRALEAAHAHGVIHRDIKPENCFVIQRGDKVDFVKVLDFGIAKVVDEERKNAHTLTQAGALIGTPEYMAPEQVQGGAADPRMDIYSVGCIMYQALTGELPFEDSTMFGVLTKQVSEDPLPMRTIAPDAEIPRVVEAVVFKAMEKNREDRYQTMTELAEALEAIDALVVEDSMPITRSSESSQSLESQIIPVEQKNLQRIVLGLAAAVVILCCLLAYFALRGDATQPEATVGATSDTAAAVAASTDATSESSSTGDIADTTDVDGPSATTAVADSDTDDATTEGDDDSDSDSDTDSDGELGAGEPPTKKKVKKGKKKSTPPDPNLPKELDLFKRNTGIRTVSDAVKKCRASTGVAPGTQVKVTIKVSGRTGKVLSAVPSTSNAAGKCVAKAVKKAKFPKFQKATQKFTQAFRL